MWRTLLGLVRGALPAVLVATLIPLTLFYTALAAGSWMWAMSVSVAYAYCIAIYQFCRRRRVSGMLLVTVFMATVRALGAAVSGHPLVYFAIPIAETAGFGLMFLATMFSGEPLVVRLARDLVPHAADGIAARRSLIRALSVIWTVTYLGSGATTLALLATLPLPVYLGAHTITGWLWTAGGAVTSVIVLSRRSIGIRAGAAGSAADACSTAAAV
jgi:hypothetical protein